MVIQTALFTCPCTKYRSYYFIATDLYLWSLSDCKQPSLWPLLRKICYATVYFPWILHSSRGKFSKIVWKCFSQVFKGFKYDVFKNFVFWWMSSFFRLLSHLNVFTYSIDSVFHNKRPCDGYHELYSWWNIDFTLKNHCPARLLYYFFGGAVRFDWIKINIWLKLGILNYLSRPKSSLL